jgi:hypothetical protein
MASWRTLAPVRVMKKVLQATIYPTGAVRSVLWGPCREIRYRIFPGYGHAYLYGGWERKSMKLMIRFLKPGSVAYETIGSQDYAGVLAEEVRVRNLQNRVRILGPHQRSDLLNLCAEHDVGLALVPTESRGRFRKGI